MARSRKILSVDTRGRITLGSLAGEHEIYIANVDVQGVITLMPHDLVPVVKPKPRRRRAATPKEPACLPQQNGTASADAEK